MIAFSKILQPKYLVFVVLTAYFFFGFQHLTQFVTADEHYWIYERIPQYWDAVAQGKWKKTFINDKPGVSLALVSGAGYFLHPDSREHCTQSSDKLIHCKTGQTEDIYFSFRLPILIMNGLLLFYLFWIIGRLTDPWIALWTTILTALSPILLGISQIVNPDSLLWSFGAAAIFSFLALLKSEEKKFFWLTIIFTGFAILTKYIAIILLPLYLALAVFRFLSAPETTKNDTLPQSLKKNILSWDAIAIGSALILCLFLPALLIDSKYIAELLGSVPNKDLLASIGGGFFALLLIDTFALKNKLLFLLRKIFLRMAVLIRCIPIFFLALFIGLIIARNFFPDWSIFTLIPFDIKNLSDVRYHTDIPNFFEVFLLEWNPLIFSLTPITLLGFISLLIALARAKTKKYRFLIYGLLFFSLTYVLLLIFSNILTTPRYSILLYPLFAFLAALGIRQLCCRPEHVEGAQPEKLRFRYAELVATLIIFLGSIISLIAIRPFYFNYTNSLLPKSALINDAWGYGGYEAAQYLNILPDAKNLIVWADYDGVCEFFVGKCLTAYTFDKEAVQPDYYILTRRGKIRYMSRASRWERLSGLTAYKYYAAPNPAWQLNIDDRPGNFIRVVRVEK